MPYRKATSGDSVDGILREFFARLIGRSYEVAARDGSVMKERFEHRRRPPRRYDIWLFPLLTLLAIILVSALNRVMPDRQWVSEQFRMAVESLGFLSGISLAVLLLSQHRDDTDAVFRVWTPVGLISMSILGVFHSFLPFGNSFIWLHSLAMLLGGLFFAIVWLPFTLRPPAGAILVALAGIAAILLGVISLSIPEILPEMLSGGSFSITTVAITITSGFFFLVAAAFFFTHYLVTRKSQEMLFACFSGLHGAAGLSFPLELPWQEGWWLLHALSYVVLLAYTFAVFKQTEDQTRTTEKSYRGIMETSMDGFFIVDGRGHFMEANDAYCRLIEYSREELLHMAIPDVEADEKPEDVAVHTKKIREKGSDRWEARHRSKNGKIIDIEVNVHYLPGGQFFVFIHDITLRKKAHAALEQREAELSVILEHIPLATILVDASQRIVRANAAMANLTGRRPQEGEGKSVCEVISCLHYLDNPTGSSSDHTCQTCKGRLLISDTFDTGKAHYQEEFTLDVDGENGARQTDLLLSTVLLPTTQKQTLVCLEDISESKKTQQQLIANDRLASIGLLVSGIAHEVGNPLTVIMGYTDQLLSNKLPGDVKKSLKVIAEESQRAAGILRNLLTFARRESEDKQPLNINESIWRILELRAYDQKTNRITVNTLLDPDLPSVMGNRSQLEQVFYNIIVNAEFSMVEAHQRGDLTVTTNYTENTVRVTFTDDGLGISEENLHRIFTPFFTTKKAGQGTGLGLSICQGIITEHGGRIYAESTLGRGATFIIELPVPPP